MSNTKTLGNTGWARGFRQFVAWSGEHPLLCAAVFFVIAFAVRLLYASRLGPIVIHIYPDEYRYLHLAKSIAEGGPLLLEGFPTDFQKILYPLFISPAFLLAQDPVAQMKIVGVINCLLMASVVFPVALLAAKLSKKAPVVPLALVFTAMLPDFTYTATLMSETLSWPLYMWVFYLFHRATGEKQHRKRLLLFALFGLTTYLAYLTKEIGAAYFIAAVAILILEGMRDRGRLKQNGLALLVSAVAFFAPLLIVKQALFPNMGNSYVGGRDGWERLISVLREPGGLAHTIYSAFALILAAVLSFYILPVLLPLFGFGKKDEGKRRMYLFSALSLVVSVGAIAGIVYTWEPQGELLPLLPMRLLAPIVVPFMILCFDFLLSKKSKSNKLGKIPVLILTATFGTLLVIMLPAVPKYDEWMDHASMTASYLKEMFVAVGMNQTSAGLVWLAYVLFMIAMTMVGVICLLAGKKRIILTMLLCTLFTVSLIDNTVSYQIIRWQKQPIHVQAYIARSTEKRVSDKYFANVMDLLFSGETLREPGRFAYSAVSVSEFIRQTQDALDSDIIVCMDTIFLQYFDTYTSQHLRRRHVPISYIRNYLEEGRKQILSADFPSYSDMKGRALSYIIVMEDENPFANVEIVYEQSPYLVLRNLDPTRLCFLDNQD